VTTGEGEGESTGVEEEDLISRLPDGVLGDIVSLLPTRDAARMQVLSPRWRPIWRTAPLNLDIRGYIVAGGVRGVRVSAGKISRILSEHDGPRRRFCAPLECFFDLGGCYAGTLDAWLRSPALAGLQELEFHLGLSRWRATPPPPLPAPVHRFASTLRVASFSGCAFPDGNGGALRLPVLQKLSLLDVSISEATQHALLASCAVLESLLLGDNNGCSLVRIVSKSLRSISLRPGPGEIKVKQLLIEDAPCLERLLLLGSGFSMGIVISVIRRQDCMLWGN